MATEWCYEWEWRHAGLKECVSSGFYYVDFWPLHVLREVIAGACNPTPEG